MRVTGGVGGRVLDPGGVAHGVSGGCPALRGPSLVIADLGLSRVWAGRSIGVMLTASMRSGHLHSGAAWLCLAVYLSLNVGVSGLVLCIGKEGHVAIESRFAEDCCDDERGASDTLGFEACDDCECTDGSLLQPAAGMRLAGWLGLSGTAQQAPSTADALVADPSCVRRGADVRPACVSPPLRARSTIVLVV